MEKAVSMEDEAIKDSTPKALLEATGSNSPKQAEAADFRQALSSLRLPPVRFQPLLLKLYRTVSWICR